MRSHTPGPVIRDFERVKTPSLSKRQQAGATTAGFGTQRACILGSRLLLFNLGTATTVCARDHGRRRATGVWHRGCSLLFLPYWWI